MSDEKKKDYSFKMLGQNRQILGVNSSCGCTAGQIIYKGETSKNSACIHRWICHDMCSGMVTAETDLQTRGYASVRSCGTGGVCHDQ